MKVVPCPVAEGTVIIQGILSLMEAPSVNQKPPLPAFSVLLVVAGRLKTRTCVTAILVVLFGSVHVQAQAQWGTLKGKLVYDGTPPAPQKPSSPIASLPTTLDT